MTDLAAAPPFSFTLLRGRLLGAHGTPLNESVPDPSAWAACDAAADAQQTDWAPLGHGRLSATVADALEFARTRFDPEAEGSFIKARLHMDLPSAPAPRMGDLLAVHVSESAAIVYEVALQIDPAELDPAAEWTIELEAGEVLLQHRADFGLMTTTGDAGE